VIKQNSPSDREPPSIQAYQATHEDTAEVTQLLVRTAQWLQSRGSTQWNGLLRGEDSLNTPEAINRGDVYVFRQGNILMGMVMLLQHPNAWDKELWGEEGHESSLYMHRLAINREYAGQEVGRLMMQWAESGVAFPGKDRIRLDCIANNPVLNAFYQGLGYEIKGLASNPVGEFNLYEKLRSI
jgi:ribosomal protein S18 acetylase RimI-like enzyme